MRYVFSVTRSIRVPTLGVKMLAQLFWQDETLITNAMSEPVSPAVPLQVYKRAKALDQSDNDISAVYRAYIH